MSDFLIQQARATMVPSPASSKARSRSDSSSAASTPKNRPPRQLSNLAVEAQGRAIPPRTGFLARTLVGYAATPPSQPLKATTPPRAVLPSYTRQRDPSPTWSGSETETSTSLLDSFGSKEETPGSSVAGVPFRMFEQPRTPPLHLIREQEDGESEVESVVGSGKSGRTRRRGG